MRKYAAWGEVNRVMINLVDEKWRNVFIDVHEIKAILPDGQYAKILLSNGLTVKVIWGQYEYDRYVQELDKKKMQDERTCKDRYKD